MYQLIKISSEGWRYATNLTFRSRAIISVSAPTLPMNIVRMMTSFPAILKKKINTCYLLHREVKKKSRRSGTKNLKCSNI